MTKRKRVNNDLHIKLKIEQHKHDKKKTLAVTLYNENYDRNYMPWHIVSTERYIVHM